MKDAVILVTKRGLGTTSAEDAAFGSEMLEKLVHTLEVMEDKPKAICFYTEGVKLVDPEQQPRTSNSLRADAANSATFPESKPEDKENLEP